ncbi:tripartite motif-containing protein 30A-like [Acomys russatus]|uniref:tripartite motif-containing protein 30A-like n=1 Tax=Acomys russatus TaxID=60746 RepID=UPI0021E2115D|nr:tripartite motif-containing protein 30A-like [Acomys russatus]
MASSILVMIKEEVTCPICLELLKEPMSAGCDHSFCRACITLNYESSKDKEGEGSCPVCRVSYEFGKLRPNRHVANIVERLSGFQCDSEEQKVIVCAQHGEKLQLFCKVDMVAICWLCERSQEHRGHHTALLEEVAHEYTEKLQAALQKLMKNEKMCDEWQNDLQKERTSWENQIQSDVENIQMEFKELRDFLDSKEEEELMELEKEKEDIMKSLEESENKLSTQRESVRELISEVEHQLQGSAMEMLQGVTSVLTRSQILILKEPRTIPKRRMFQAPELKDMMQLFQGLMDVQRYWVHVGLNRKNKENVFTDKEQIQIQSANHYESKDVGVLGYPAIQSGKHYWEVDVSRSKAWLLGLNDGQCAKPKALHSSNGMGIKVKQSVPLIEDVCYQPKCGYWIIGMKNKDVYNAFDECSVTHKPSVLALSLPIPPTRVGVFLDREACTLSFYDVSNHRALIYRFYDLSFPDKLYPYFNPMGSEEPMIVHGPPS